MMKNAINLWDKILITLLTLIFILLLFLSCLISKILRSDKDKALNIIFNTEDISEEYTI